MTDRNYSTEILYSPFGGLTKEKFGTSTPVYNKLFYNSRGQLAEIRDSTSWSGQSDTTWNRGAIINRYSAQCSGLCGGTNSATPMTDNNGNLLKQEVFIPNDDQISGYTLRWQQYDYDGLNRLNWAREVKDGVEQWRQWFHYDQWGNRTIDFTQDPGDSHLRTYGINSNQFKIDPQTNQLFAPNLQYLQHYQLKTAVCSAVFYWMSAPEWASLPGSPYGQGTRSMNSLKKVYGPSFLNCVQAVQSMRMQMEVPSSLEICGLVVRS